MQSKPAILVVDDHATNRRLYQAVLQELDVELVMAGSGEEALKRYGERPWAMVLLDVHLADTDGFEVAQRIRDVYGAVDTPVVFVSATYVHERDTYRGYRLGAVDYILSPIVPEILRAKAAVFIRLQRARLEAQAQAAATEHALRELRDSQAEMDGFGYAMSHDLRTPLGQIVGFADLMALGHAGELGDTARTYVGHIQDAAQRMSDLIDDLVQLASLSRGEMVAEAVNLSHLIEEIGAGLAAAQPQRQLAWQVQPNVVVQGDPRLMRAALAQLIGNAWRHGGGHIVFGAVDRETERVYFVGDDGPGVDPGERQGGIALAVVHRVVAKHGGRLWIDAAPGQGTRVHFTLPPPSNVAAAWLG